MNIVLGASGHVGSAVVDALVRAGEPVIAVIRDPAKADAVRSRGAAIAVVDVGGTGALRDVLRQGRRAFLLNPPAPPTTDTDAQEHRTLASIVAALDGSGLEKVVLESTYGAQQGERIGDLSVLHHFETALAGQPIPAAVVRAAYYMSNFDALHAAAVKGALPTMFPPDLTIPMVAPADIGVEAARLLVGPVGRAETRYVEGPARYTMTDVAAAFARALGREVRLDVTPRDEWTAQFRAIGFSESAAAAYTRMTAVTVDGGFDLPEAPRRGETTLDAYISDLVRRNDTTGGDERD